MNREETRKAAEIMLAYANGEEIEWGNKINTKWRLLKSNTIPTWDWDNLNYRIKPKPREIWVRQYDDGRLGPCRYDSKEEAQKDDKYPSNQYIKFREVTDE